MECRDVTGHCGPEGRNFEEVTWSHHWSRQYRSIIVLAIIVLIVLFWVSWSKADDPVPDSWAAQIEITDDARLVPSDKAHEFDTEFGAPFQQRDGDMEEGGELDPTGKPVDIHIENLRRNGDE